MFDELLREARKLIGEYRMSVGILKPENIDLISRIDAHLASGGWIDCKDRLPTHIHSVLGVITDGPFHVPTADLQRDIVSYDPTTKEWLQYEGEKGDAVVQVSHWQPLPSLPKDAK